MTGRTRFEAIPIDDVYVFTDGHARLANLRIEAIKLVLTGSDLRKVAEAIAPKWAGPCFNDWTKEQQEEKIRSIRKSIPRWIAKLSDEQKQRILLS